MSRHTPEPWSTEYRERHDGMFAQEIIDANGETIAILTWHPVRTPTGITTDRQANARRIVVCVNACAGMRNDELEGGLLLGVMEKRIAELEQQQNNLTDTCARLIGTIAAIGAVCNEAIDEKSNAAAVVAGLAKATKDILSEIQGVKK